MKKSKKVSWLDRLVIRLALFFGIAGLMNFRQVRILFRVAKYPKYSGIGLWLRGRFTLYMFSPMWLSVHGRWVKLADSESLVKDAFFTARVGYGKGVENPIANMAVAKWLEFLTDPTNEYHRKMVFRLAVGSPCWTENGTKANLMAKRRLDEFAGYLVGRAKTREEIRQWWYYVRAGSLVERELLRLVELGKLPARPRGAFVECTA